MSVGGPVHTYRTRSQVEEPLHACSVHIVQLLITLGSDSKLRYCDIYIWPGIYINNPSMFKFIELLNSTGKIFGKSSFVRHKSTLM